MTKRKREQTQKTQKRKHKNVAVNAGDSQRNAAPANDADSEDIEVDETVLGTSSAYTALLASLESSGGAFAEAYALRRRDEEGQSSSDEDEHEEKSSQEKRGNTIEEGASEEHQEDDNEPKADDKDETANDSPAVDSFQGHLEHDLTTEEIHSLDNGKLKMKYETPAFGLRNAKWISNVDFPKIAKSISDYSVKLKLRSSWENIHKKSKFGDFYSEQQCQFFSLCHSYRDIMYSRKSFDGTQEGEKIDNIISDAYLLHVLNHVLKTKNAVVKNNEKIHRQESSGSMVDPPKDQGFTRPKVMMILPLRSSVLKIVKRLIELTPPSQKVMVDHKQRFLDDFGAEEDESNKEKSKPCDYKALFSGNNDDHFRIGMQFTKKAIKLYTDFNSSDIIFASPIGLMTCMSEAAADKEKDVDFLSSIEILIVDFADVILMQNWFHVTSIFDQLNKIPSKQHDTDIMRVREWYLNGHARYYRQTIFLSAYADAAINALFLRACVNHSGKVKLQCEYDGVLSNVLLQVRQVYERLDCTSIADVDNSRFDFFVNKIFPRMKESLHGGILLYVRSYFDFVRVRNFLKAESASFCALGDYTKQSEISRCRSWFFHGKRRIMLYTERAHFYHRYRIRGIREIIFYALPDHPHFYTEMSNMLEGVDNPSTTILFSKFDKLQLERIVGTSRANKMLASQNKMLMFC